MNTLLTNEQILRIHKGDCISARCRVFPGYTFTKGLFRYMCVDNIVFKIDTCPHCKSHNTFHKRMQDIRTKNNDRYFDNVYKVYDISNFKSRLFHKIDYCFNCHKEFSIEIFLYKKRLRFSK